MIGLTPYTTLSQFLIYAIIVVLVNQGVRILKGLTWSTILSETNAIIINKVFENFLLIYDPLVLLLLLSTLIGVKPSMILPIVVILLIISHRHWCNYISRSVVMINKRIKQGVYIHSGDVNGKVIKFGKLGTEVQTQKGIHMLSYQSLLDKGYTISGGDEISRLYTIIFVNEIKGNKDPETRLLDQLANTPYIDWSSIPEIGVSGIHKDKITLRVVLRDKSHLDDIVSLLREWQYSDIAVNH